MLQGTYTKLKKQESKVNTEERRGEENPICAPCGPRAETGDFARSPISDSHSTVDTKRLFLRAVI